MTLLTKQQILSAADLRTEDVKVPEWADPASGADTVRVKSLTGRERDAFEASLVQTRGGKRETNLANIRAKLVSLALVDETGSKLFTEDEVAFLGNKSAAALDRVFTVAQRLNGISQDDIKALEKNSEAGPSGSSTSSSVKRSGWRTPTNCSIGSVHRSFPNGSRSRTSAACRKTAPTLVLLVSAR